MEYFKTTGGEQAISIEVFNDGSSGVLNQAVRCTSGRGYSIIGGVVLL